METKRILDGLQKQRERGFLCDVNLEADGTNLVLFGGLVSLFHVRTSIFSKHINVLYANCRIFIFRILL